jgi:rhamnose ABC transporter rhamnose-binding protein
MFKKVLPLVFLFLVTTVLAIEPVKIFMIPKFTGAPYFVATEKGARIAVNELNSLGLTVDFFYTGPSVANTEEQIRIISSLIEQKPDALIVSPNDAEALSSILRKARQNGIRVITYDADVVDPEARDVFVNQATFRGVGETLVELVAENVGPEARIAIISADPNARNQNEWIAAMKKYIGEKYPKMKIVTIKYGYDRPAESLQAAQDIINAYYPNVDAIVAPTSVALPMAAEAVLKAGLKGKIFVTGLATPNDVRRYVKEGVIKKFALWNPKDLGYLALYVANALARNMVFEIDGERFVCGGKLGLYKIQEVEGSPNVIVLGPPLIFDENNIDQFDF